MLGSELLLKCLEDQGVETVFGIPGGVVLPLYDVLKKSKLKHILTRHEQGAAHAADGYARATGNVGVCISTSGPGATNLLTGLATAHMDSSPVVAITGQVAKPMLGKDSFQEADIVGLSQPITKNNYLVKNAEELPDIIAEAFFIAANGRPGPVLIDIPKDVFLQEVEEKSRTPEIRKRLNKKFCKPPIDEENFNAIIDILKNAKRPLILAGGGAASSEKAQTLLTRLAVKNEIPVTVTLMGKGVFPADNLLYLGMLGMHGTRQANWAVQNCDCLLALGMRFDDRVTSNIENFASKAKIIHVDIDAAEIGKNVIPTISLVADSGDFLEKLNNVLWAKKCTKEWVKQIRKYVTYDRDISSNLLQPENILGFINELIDEETIIVTDVGQHQMWAALYLHPQKTRSFITSGGLGTMGFGLPAAVGAQIAHPQKKVVLITGDGSLQMNIQELAVVKKWNLPIKIILLNNGCLGMVRQWQELFFQENYAESSLDYSPDWVKLAGAYGITASTIKKAGEDRKILRKVLESSMPWLVNLEIDPGANVYPIVPSGCSLDQMWGRWKDETHTSSIS